MRRKFLVCLATLCSSLFVSDFIGGQPAIEKRTKNPSTDLFPGIKKRPRQLSAGSTELSKQSLIEWTQPGIATRRNGTWVGESYLPNVPKSLAVNLQITQFEEHKIEVPEEAWKRAAEDELSSAGYGVGSLEGEILPFYHIQLILYPFAEGHVVSLSGRLLQSVQFPRIQFDPGYEYQAIFWEKGLLIYFPAEHLEEQVAQRIREMTKELTAVFKDSEQRQPTPK